MRKPDFFIVGAPKSATTAMYEYLRQHPKIFMPVVKELHYFGTDLQFLPPSQNFKMCPRSLDEQKRYLAFFSSARESQIMGEASVWYLYSKCAAKEIKLFSPNAKIIIMLRNPVDLLYSMHSQYLWDGNEDIEDFFEALSAEPYRKAGKRLPKMMHFRDGLYYRDTVQFSAQIQRYLDVFESKNILILIYEEFSNEPKRTYNKVLNFLEVSTSFTPEFQRVNANKQVRSRMLLNVLKKPNPILKYSVKIIPRVWRSVLLHYLNRINTQYTSRPPLDPALRKQLLQTFEPDIQSLQEILHRDLSIWLT